MRVQDIIDARWNKQLHRPLHITGYYLNPAIHYEDNFKCKVEIKEREYDCIERMVSTTKERILTSFQLDLFHVAHGRDKKDEL